MFKPFIIVATTLALALGCQAKSPTAMPPNSLMRGAEILASTDLWMTTEVLTLTGEDVTDANMGYVGLSTYNAQAQTYEFFTLDGAPRDDKGLFYITEEPRMRVHYSQTRNYFRPVLIVELTGEVFTYEVVNSEGQTVHVVHRPVFAN